MTRNGSESVRKEAEGIWCYEQQLKGLSLRAIAKLTETEPPAGRSLSYPTVMRRIDALHEAEVKPKPGMLRQTELDRLDSYLAAMADQIREGDTAAIAVALRISERRAKLLALDAPAEVAMDATIRFEIVGADPDDL